MRQINKIVIHHSGNHNTKKLIYKLHVKDFGWEDIGYHFLITNQGEIQTGRSIEKIGAHTLEHNADSIGICLLGNFDIHCPTNMQINALKDLIKELKTKYNIKEIKLHRDYSTKSCPGKNFKSSVIAGL